MKVQEHVFISYSSKDKFLVNELVEYLESKGLSCWFAPRDILPGTHYASSILEAIRSANAFVIVFSYFSNESEQVLKEVDRAVNAKLPVIPFRIDQTMPTEAMDYYLCNTHWLDAFDGTSQSYFESLVHTLHEYLSGVGQQTRVTETINTKPSEQLENIIKKFETQAKEEEEQGLEFIKKQEREKKELESLEERNKTNFTLKNIEKESQIVLTKKKVKKEKVKPEKEINTKPNLFVRNKAYIYLFFGVILLTFYAKLELNSKRQKSNETRALLKNKKKKYKGLELNSIELVEGTLDKAFLELEFVQGLSSSKMKLLHEQILQRNGEAFIESREGLIEKPWNKFEMHNLFLLKFFLLSELIADQEKSRKKFYVEFKTEDAPNLETSRSIWVNLYKMFEGHIYGNTATLMPYRYTPSGSIANIDSDGGVIIQFSVKLGESSFIELKKTENLNLISASSKIQEIASQQEFEFEESFLESRKSRPMALIEINLKKEGMKESYLRSLVSRQMEQIIEAIIYDKGTL
ncbi:MAG: toll/interleukin-1 receptor domain-containing protein [Bacteriovoracaceae bacterium]